MIAHIFDIVKDKVVLNQNILTIPELKAVYEKYKGDMQPFQFLHFMSAPDSPYFNLDEREKEDVVYKKYKGAYNPADYEISTALKELTKLYDTPVKRLYVSAKIALDKLSAYYQTTPVKDGKDGNITQFTNQLLKIQQIAQGYKAAESMLDEEMISIRGQAAIGIGEWD